MTDLAAYLLDNYGVCTAETCRCLKPSKPWLGRACPHWRPAGARNWEELRAFGQNQYARNA